MCPNLYSTDYLDVNFRADLGLLLGRWLRAVSEAELLAGYDNLRRATLHCGATSWFIDSRRRTSHSHYSPEWVTTTFLPRLQRELGRPLFVSFLMLPDYLSSRVDAPGSCPSTSPVQFACFLDEGAAHAWLKARLPLAA
ncbi:hypothetical protein [Hymenobacter cheonanensis]|uniref:hypothetical protein n=1 Tax=Hymenobacter sp. CA2-7 TaxID=3063993 RepID=UPI0027126223|nr:hypothetical protein [Hymenobacter sp. CA2-7]MDO7888260.1 hypothetical protein [Hymenobacter sp. CA2-7]